MDFVPGPTTAVLVLSALLILPVALTLRFRSNAMSASPSDRAGAWFAFTRSLRWTLTAALVLWWAATDFTGLRGYASRVTDPLGWSQGPAGNILSISLVWLPILLVMVLCSVLSQPVYARVRGLDWTRWEMTKLSLLRVGTAYVPLILIFGSIGALDEYRGLKTFLISFAAAAVLYFAGSRVLRRKLGWRPEAVTSGELRDRAFALAHNMGAKLNQLYVMPAGKMQTANAFASTANAVLLTDYLLAQLNKREVDAIVAHELAHLKHGHAKTRGVVGGAMSAVIVIWCMTAPHSVWQPILMILACCAYLSILYFISRRFEFTADREGARLTGDPQSLISGLAKVHALNVFPVQWGKFNEKAMTHPSATRRAMAIAKATGLPVERVPAVLQSALVESDSSAANPGDRYTLPEGARSGAKVYSTELKHRISWGTYWVSLAAITVIPAAVVRGIVAAGWDIPGWLIFCEAACAAMVCRGASLTAFTLGWSKRIARLIHAKAEQEGAQPEAWKGAFVGFSPDAGVRVYDGSYWWDLGYLFFTGDQICYLGEMTRFALRREQVISVRLGRGVPSWWRTPIVYVTWLKELNAREETFRVGCGRSGVFSGPGMNRALEKRITAWVAGGHEAASAITDPTPEMLAVLHAPAIGATTSSAVKRGAWFRQFLKSAVIVGFVAGCASALFGIGVDIASPIARITGMDAPEAGVWSGWYAIFASWIALAWSFLPFWVFREAKPGGSGGLNQVRPAPEPK